MTQKIIVIYDLKGKTNAQKTAIQKKLYGHRDKSNYVYIYEREGLFNKIDVVKSKKVVLQVKNKHDLPNVVQALKELDVTFDIAKA